MSLKKKVKFVTGSSSEAEYKAVENATAGFWALETLPAELQHVSFHNV